MSSLLGNQSDGDEISALESKIMSYCNLIPVGCWGFDDDVKESLKQRKHSLVNRQLSKKERMSLPSQSKQQIAKNIGIVPTTVQEVLEWMSTSKKHSNVQPVNPKNNKNMTVDKTKVSKPMRKETEKKVEEDDKEDDSSDEDEKEEQNNDEEETVSAESSDEEETVNDEDETESEENIAVNGKVEESDDSSDEEDENQEPKTKKSKIPNSVLKSNSKIDEEIQKLEDESSESLEDKRQLALLKLQKKLNDFKQDRKGKGKAAKMTPEMAQKAEEERRLKRRESKLKLKQRRVAEKQLKENEKAVKKEEKSENDDEDKSNEKKTSIAFNKLKFEVKAEKKGKKDRTPKKERGLKLTGRDYKSLIAKVEETKAQIEKVREADPHKATIMEDELKWAKTMKRAAGGKVKDNLEKLKKALNKKNKMKEKKKEKWENRISKVSTEKEKKQEKRKQNLKKRIDEVKKRKLNKLKKKGRVL
ncbi:unnamed protein product [Caenorhabditis bovis]|uniref:Ribosomal RNA-processing protein 14/surfeit locus protein 6 C-terminal domain-containing protein n=1 Tax=Caenorhabditis bovis TaxID=2654633 RepID=A0A8S1EQU1_9PELO|nr:unnamed protein product [Caenorhabditis bovis]